MDGREKCKILKQIRANIAKEYGIDGYEYKECTNTGYCNGTCPACDNEATELQALLCEKGVKIKVPRDPALPKDLIGVMDEATFYDMQSLLRHYRNEQIDYDRIPGGRIVSVRGEKMEKYLEEQRRRYEQNGRRALGGMIAPYKPDFDALEKEAEAREKAHLRKIKFDNSALGKIRGLLKRKKDGDKK